MPGQAAPQTAPHQRPWCFFIRLLGLSLSLGACTSPTKPPASAAMQETRAPAPKTPTAGPAWRVIVKFRQAVPYRDAAFLQDIAQKIQARIGYLSSVSADTHVYHIEPQADLSRADILRRLADMASVQYAETDALVKPL